MTSQRSQINGNYIDIVYEVASREGVPPTDLPPLFDVVDPDALDALVSPPGDERVSVGFRYCGYEVTVDSTGHLTVDGDS